MATWGYWCDTTSAGTASTNCDIWGSWADNTTNTTYATTSDTISVWFTWAGNEFTLPFNAKYRQPELTAEQIEERRVQQERARVENELRLQEARERTAKAEERASLLLMMLLNLAQYADWRDRQGFIVIAASGRRYQIKKGYAGNVYELDKDDRRIASYCGHISSSDGPAIDNMIAQKLMIESDEQRFLQIANQHMVSPPQPAWC